MSIWNSELLLSDLIPICFELPAADVRLPHNMKLRIADYDPADGN